MRILRTLSLSVFQFRMETQRAIRPTTLYPRMDGRPVAAAQRHRRAGRRSMPLSKGGDTSLNLHMGPPPRFCVQAPSNRARGQERVSCIAPALQQSQAGQPGAEALDSATEKPPRKGDGRELERKGLERVKIYKQGWQDQAGHLGPPLGTNLRKSKTVTAVNRDEAHATDTEGPPGDWQGRSLPWGRPRELPYSAHSSPCLFCAIP